MGIESVAELHAHGRPGVATFVEQAGTLALALPIALQGSVDALLTSMNRAGIERTVLIGSPGVASNEWLLGEAVPQGAGRLVPVVTLPPLPKDADKAKWVDAWDALATAGAAGFKIHPNMDGLGAQHVAWEALFEVAAARGVFVILHTGCFHVPTYRVGGPVKVGEFERYFAAFPGVRVCLAHMGREEPEPVWSALRRYPQLFTDTSWQPAEVVARAVQEVGADRILLGSDWPLLHADLQADALAVLRKAVGDGSEVFRAIAEENPLRFLGGV